jgi:hypothetical protein
MARDLWSEDLWRKNNPSRQAACLRVQVCS